MMSKLMYYTPPEQQQFSEFVVKKAAAFAEFFGDDHHKWRRNEGLLPGVGPVNPEQPYSSLWQTYAGMHFKPNQMFRAQLNSQLTGILKMIKWLSSAEFRETTGATQKDITFVFDEFLFGTQYIRDKSRQRPGVMLPTAKSQHSDALHHKGAGFRMPLDWPSDPTKVLAYEKKMEALITSFTETMDYLVQRAIVQCGTAASQRPSTGQAPVLFTSEQSFSQTLERDCNETFAVNKNGSGFADLEHRAIEALGRRGYTPDTILASAGVITRVTVTDPVHHLRMGAPPLMRRQAVADEEHTTPRHRTVTGGLEAASSRSMAFPNGTTSDATVNTKFVPEIFYSLTGNVNADYKSADDTIAFLDADSGAVKEFTRLAICEQSGMFKKGTGRGELSTNGAKFVENISGSGSMASLFNIGGFWTFVRRKVTPMLRNKDGSRIAFGDDVEAYAMQDLAVVVEKGLPEFDAKASLSALRSGTVKWTDTEVRVLNHLAPLLNVYNINSEELAKLANTTSVDVTDIQTAIGNYTINPDLDGINAIAAEIEGKVAVLGASIRKVNLEMVFRDKPTLEMMRFLHTHNIPIPFGFAIPRPWPRYHAGSASYLSSKNSPRGKPSVFMVCQNSGVTYSESAQDNSVDVEVAITAGPIIPDRKSVLTQPNISCEGYINGGGTRMLNWDDQAMLSAFRGRPNGPFPFDMFAVPVPFNYQPRNWYTILSPGKISTRLFPTSTHEHTNIQHAATILNLPSDIRGRTPFEHTGVVAPRLKDQIIVVRGAQFATRNGQLVDLMSGRTALGPACSITDFNQIKGNGGTLAGSGIRGGYINRPLYGGMGPASDVPSFSSGTGIIGMRASSSSSSGGSWPASTGSADDADPLLGKRQR